MTGLRLRIATFNLESLDDRPGSEPPLEARIAVLRPQLLRLDADILCLQEVNAQATGKNGPRALRALDRLLAGTPYETFQRAHSRTRAGALADIHNLVMLSRLPIRDSRQYWHDLVPAPLYRRVTARPPDDTPQPVEWDRPALYATLDLGGRALHVFNLHLRAPLASFVPGRKEGQFVWKSSAAWAEGYFLAAMKRTGQAFEVRRAVDAIFDSDPAALIAVCGDLNADLAETPVRVLISAEEDTANGKLARRVLVPVESSVPSGGRFSVLHAGRRVLPDHILASKDLTDGFVRTEIRNQALEDEVVSYALAHGSPESFHAPIVAEFSLPEDAHDQSPALP